MHSLQQLKVKNIKIFLKQELIKEKNRYGTSHFVPYPFYHIILIIANSIYEASAFIILLKIIPKVRLSTVSGEVRL